MIDQNKNKVSSFTFASNEVSSNQQKQLFFSVFLMAEKIKPVNYRKQNNTTAIVIKTMEIERERYYLTVEKIERVYFLHSEKKPICIFFELGTQNSPHFSSVFK